jgi:dolichol-phosphate mannosyltransferase
MRECLISIIIPARNERRLIGRTLDSVLRAAQRIDNDEYEVIVVDNASADGTWAILKEYTKQPSVRTYKLACRGAARARNFGRRQACGQILVFLDADTHIPDDALAIGRQRDRATIFSLAGRRTRRFRES